MKNSLTVEETGIAYSEGKCCGKITFSSQEDALASIKAGGKRKNKTHKPFRAYKCSQGNWHLSSVSKKSHKKMLDSIKKVNKQ